MVVCPPPGLFRIYREINAIGGTHSTDGGGTKKEDKSRQIRAETKTMLDAHSFSHLVLSLVIIRIHGFPAHLCARGWQKGGVYFPPFS